MKISKEQKQLTKTKILESAIDLITKKGFSNATMKDIAKQAGVSNPTIYNYFPTKEDILYEYIRSIHIKSVDILQDIKDFHTYSLKEQLQTLVLTELDLLAKNKNFISEISKMVFYSSSIKLESLHATKDIFINLVDDMIDISIEAGEIDKQPFRSHLSMLFWDYYIVIVAYWLEDESKDFANTVEFVDRSMDLMETFWKSNLLTKTAELGMFLFKTHIVDSLKNFSSKDSKFDGIKRKLKEVISDE